MTFLPTDYLLIAAVFAVVLVRIVTDIRETVQLQRLTLLAYTIAQQHFSPALTIIMPMNSIDDTKHTTQQLQSDEYTAELLIVVDSTAQPRAASRLRYFFKKHDIKNVKVVASKQPNLHKIAATRATGELVVVLPDTVRLSTSFYRSALLPFGNPKLHSLQLAPSIRPSNTVTSALETLHIAWTRYMWWLPSIAASPLLATQLPEGLVVRAATLTSLAMQQQATRGQKPCYSRAPHRTTRTAWRQATSSATSSDYVTVGLLAASGVLLAYVSHNTLLVFGVIVCLFVVLGWWALTTAQLSFAKRLEIILLAPVFFAALCATVATHVVQVATRKLA